MTSRIGFVAPVILALTLGLSCGKHMIAAFGSNSGIAILTDKRCYDEAIKLKHLLEKDVLTVQWEKSFEVEVIIFSGKREDLSHKNIIILDYLSPKSRLEGKIKAVAGNDFARLKNGEKTFVTKFDLWATGQVVMVITALTKNDLDLLIDRESDRIFDLVESRVQARLDRALFYPGEQKDVSERLRANYGWTLRLPTGYEVNEKFAKDGVIKILKDQPARMITVWALPASQSRSIDWLDLKRRLAWEYWDEDAIVEENLKIQDGKLGSRTATVISGRWENKKYTIGGIFETYCFECKECRYYYLIDLAVFAPGLAKLPLLRELRAIASTFTCRNSI